MPPITCPHIQEHMQQPLHGGAEEAADLVLFAITKDAENNGGSIDWQAIHDIAAYMLTNHPKGK